MELKSTTNAIFIFRTIIKRALEVRKEVYLYFRAFNKVRHDERITHLTQLKIDEKALLVMKKCTGNIKQQCEMIGKSGYWKKKTKKKQTWCQKSMVCAFPQTF